MFLKLLLNLNVKIYLICGLDGIYLKV